VGFDNVDRDAATAAGVPVGNTPGVLSEATADTALLLILSVARRAFDLHKSIGRDEWKFFEPMGKLGFDIERKTLGVFGLGSIGYELARRCRAAFNMNIIYHNRTRNTRAETELAAKYVSFDELLAQSDVISVHTALTPETKDRFDRIAFSKMKPTSIFVNTARGAIHNEADLLEALQKQVIWGAGLDVTNPEPMRADNPLLDMPTVAVLPHIGSGTIETRNGMSVLAARNIIAGLKGERMPFCINPEVYDR
jgi:lactate dehydrogenase-like 2-hydroxyacid dehydrogenase